MEMNFVKKTFSIELIYSIFFFCDLVYPAESYDLFLSQPLQDSKKIYKAQFAPPQSPDELSQDSTMDLILQPMSADLETNRVEPELIVIPPPQSDRTQQTTEETSTNQTAAPLQTAPRKRGRPRKRRANQLKNPKPTLPQEKNIPPSTDPFNFNPEGESVTANPPNSNAETQPPTVAPTKKKRGRKPKARPNLVGQIKTEATGEIGVANGQESQQQDQQGLASPQLSDVLKKKKIQLLKPKKKRSAKKEGSKKCRLCSSEKVFIRPHRIFMVKINFQPSALSLQSNFFFFYPVFSERKNVAA